MFSSEFNGHFLHLSRDALLYFQNLNSGELNEFMWRKRTLWELDLNQSIESELDFMHSQNRIVIPIFADLEMHSSGTPDAVVLTLDNVQSFSHPLDVAHIDQLMLFSIVKQI